nr:hypothetical protein [uncultured Sphaerochaeta sp.]
MKDLFRVRSQEIEQGKLCGSEFNLLPIEHALMFVLVHDKPISFYHEVLLLQFLCPSQNSALILLARTFALNGLLR